MVRKVSSVIKRVSMRPDPKKGRIQAYAQTGRDTAELTFFDFLLNLHS